MPFLIIIYQFIDQIMFIANSPEHYLQYLSIVDQNGQHYYIQCSTCRCSQRSDLLTFKCIRTSVYQMQIICTIFIPCNTPNKLTKRCKNSLVSEFKPFRLRSLMYTYIIFFKLCGIFRWITLTQYMYMQQQCI